MRRARPSSSSGRRSGARAQAGWDLAGLHVAVGDEPLDGAAQGLAQRRIDRGYGFLVPADVQLHIYQEALIIFYGKTTVYLKLLHKTMSDQWQHWIG